MARVQQSTRESPAGEERDPGAITYPLPKGVAVDREVRVRTRDGIQLAATVFRPDREGRFPVVMCVTAYGKDFGPAEYSTLPKIRKAGMAVGVLHISDATTWEGPDPGFWVPSGYAVVVANARGYYDSGGKAGIYSEADADDYADLIEWAGIQTWSNGSVGLNGVSYLAVNQWILASRHKPPHLKAMTPWEGVTDFMRDMMRPGGIPETRFLGGYYAGSLARGAGDDIITHGPAMLERVARDPVSLERIDVPALICASWSDHGLHSRGSFEGFMRISSDQKWLYTHGGNKWEVYYSPDALEWQKSFFDHFLKGEDNGFEQRPRVRLEVRRTREDYEVRPDTVWPPSRATFIPLYLDLEEGKLLPEPPLGRQWRSYDAQSRQTLEFRLPFDRSAEITGPMVLKMWVSAENADDLDLFVAVRKFDCNGREVNFYGKDGNREGAVALGWLRVSHRRLDPCLSMPYRPYLSHSQPEKVQPGEVIPVDIEILPSSTVFGPDESLQLVVSGRDIIESVRFGHDDTVNVGRHRIYAGTEYPSHLLVPFC